MIALWLIGASFALAIGLGLYARRGRTMKLEEWSVGGRRFGTLFVFLLMAGEIYTTFTLLGGSGWAYGKGAPAFYIICYGTVAYVMSYWMLPPIWRYATEHKLLSQADFWSKKYESRGLGLLVALVGVVALIPYLVLQLKGLGLIVSEASYGRVEATTAIWIGTVALVTYVSASGIHGSALTALAKDVMILVVVVALGILLPWRLYGGIGEMFVRIEAERPGFLVLPARGYSASWFSSTVLLSALGLYLWPQNFASIFTAKGTGALRKNAILMPLYQLVLLFVFFIGFAALLSVPGLEGADADLALLRVTRAQFGPWIVGLVGAAGMLTALVPGSLILMSIATTLARIVRPRRDGDPPDSATWARVLVPVLAGVALLFTFRGGTTLVTLLLMAYSMVTQLFPPLLASLMPAARITASGAIAGILAGEAAVAANTIGGLSMPALLPQWPHAITDINTGFLALLLNVCTMLIVSRLTPPRTRPRTPRVG